MTDFKDKIRLVREKKGLSRRALGDILGVPEGKIQKIEIGFQRADHEFLSLMARKLKVDLNWLLADEGPISQDAPDAPPSPIDKMLLAETLRLVDDWLVTNCRTMKADRKAEVVASIYAMAIEDTSDGKPAVASNRVAHILKLVG